MMGKAQRQTLRRVSLQWLSMALGVWMIVMITAGAARQEVSGHKVYVAFGFHVNLYHSFRNDTNDESGFGQDIRVIRHIIDTLDRFNDQGVPVKGVWDFDNLFSLQERLPQFAPDIIENIRRRVDGDQDEVILMSYNNGLASAMTRRELTDAIQWAISNPWASGVRDIFKTFSPIVRPQEMMTTPGNFQLYRQLGIKAVSLYHSATPFDAFRVFSRPLSMTEAHNPIEYRNPDSGESMTIIPTYNIGDLVENVSLSHWVQRLRRLQNSGDIKQDVLIYINFDADSEFWSGIDLWWPLDWLPNTGGLEGLINEIKHKEYVRFTTLDDYLKDHPPAGTFHFGQDTADGSFDGYDSWAEKADAQEYWTRIEHHRRIHAMAHKAMAMVPRPSIREQMETLLNDLYGMRLRALSTTNFGMATPYLAPGRELAMDELLDQMDRSAHALEKLMVDALKPEGTHRWMPDDVQRTLEPLDTFLLINLQEDHNPTSGRFLHTFLPPGDYGRSSFFLADRQDRRIPAKLVQESLNGIGNHPPAGKFFVAHHHKLEDGIYTLLVDRREQCQAGGPDLQTEPFGNNTIEMRFAEDGRVASISYKGEKKVEAGSLTPYMVYEGKIYAPQKMSVQSAGAACQGVAAIRVTGTWHGPNHRTHHPGRVDYTFSLIDELPYLFLHGHIAYPRTYRSQIIKAGTPPLTHLTDAGWQEVAPAEIRFAHRSDTRNPLRVIKHNYLDVASSYRVDYFRHSTMNLSLDSINNHITCAYFAMVAGHRAMAVAMDTHVRSNFAFAPLKMIWEAKHSTFAVKANPFGTYHGRQYVHPTWGNRQGYESVLASGEQFHSSAPTYNGTTSTFALMLAFFNSTKMPQEIKNDLLAYARAPMTLSLIHPNAEAPPPQIQKPALQVVKEKERDLHIKVPLTLAIKVLWANISALIVNHTL
jgi:hypothetical protein